MWLGCCEDPGIDKVGFIFSAHEDAGDITFKGSERQRQHLLAEGLKGDTKSSFTRKKKLTALPLRIMKRRYLLTTPARALLLGRATPLPRGEERTQERVR